MRLKGSVTTENMNQNLLGVEYAVRGPVLERAEQIERELMKGVIKPFNRVLRVNVGDSQALGQKPFTFIRQVLAMVTCPQLIPTADVPEDVKERVREILADCTKQSVGSYSPSLGLHCVRQEAARYLARRDGVPAYTHDIIVGQGATDLIRALLAVFAVDVDGKPPAVMVPVPQYPVFSGALAELGMRRVDYFLDEEHGWALTAEALHSAYHSHATQCNIRAIVVINPGNPTGQVLSRDSIEMVIKFAYQHKLFIIADEVYQENIVGKSFCSFKKVMQEMDTPYSCMELASLMTLSKGWAAECGLRGGLMELRGVAKGVRAALGRARALMQCPTVLAQCALHCVLRPPRPSEPSHALWLAERSHVHDILSRRTRDVFKAFNDIAGYSCNQIDGAMFAFPRVEIPKRAQKEAKEKGMLPDEFYCFSLLEETGVCAVPGSGFGQSPGTFHIRVAILLEDDDDFQHLITSVRDFHPKFLNKYQDLE